MPAWIGFGEGPQPKLQTAVFSVFSHGRERMRKFSEIPFIKYGIERAAPSWLNYLPEVYLLTPSHLGLGFQHVLGWG